MVQHDSAHSDATSVATSVAHRSRMARALDEHGIDALPSLIERRLVEWWFLHEQTELNALLDRVEPAVLAQSGLASTLFVLTGGSASDAEKDARFRARVDGFAETTLAAARRRSPAQRLAVALVWRLRGRTREALALAQTAAPDGAPPLLSDPSAGWAAFIALQTATTAALAGELDAARDALQFVTVTKHAPHLMFQLRDAYVLGATLDATFGEPEDARTALALAAAVPRTDGWVEAHIDARVDALTRLLDGREGAPSLRTPGPDLQGELWPYAALALGDSAMLSGAFRELDAHAARLDRVLRRDDAADGLPATALPWLRAVVALEEVRLDDAREQLDRCDDAVPLTAIGKAVLALRRHEPERALAEAARLEAMSGGYARLVVVARYLRAEAVVKMNRDADAALTLQSIPPVSRWVLEHSAIAVSAVLIDCLERPTIRASEAPAVQALVASRGHGVPMPQAPVLTARQRDMLGLLRLGHSRSEIANALHLSPNTVKTHLRMLFDRLEATSRDEAVRKAIAWGLVS